MREQAFRGLLAREAEMTRLPTTRHMRMIRNRCGEIPHASATSFEDLRRIGLPVGLVSARRLTRFVERTPRR
jgi:hypothetical protein